MTSVLLIAPRGSQAKLNNFEKDLGLVGENFNTAVSILNVGYEGLNSHILLKALILSQLYADANTLQYDSNQSPAFPLHSLLGLYLVLHICSYR